MKKILLAFLVCLSACTHRNNDVIAIGVVLVPSEKMNEQAVYLNKLIVQNNPESYRLDENSIPHITLLQAFVLQKDLPKIEKSLQGLFKQVAGEKLNAYRMFYYPEREKSYASVQIERSPSLLKLHEEVIERISPFLVKSGSSDAFVPGADGSSVDEFTLNYVPRFVEEHSFENFDPHISLGVAHSAYLDTLSMKVFGPIAFQPASLAIYQLGNSGTAQKQLWTSDSKTK